MQARLWSDYLCPWCYVGQARTALLRDLGVEVTALPYELHPEIPAEGRTVRADGRLSPTFDRIEAECEQLGFEFRRPTRMPNTRRALATADVVRTQWPAAFDDLDRALFHAQFVTGDPIDDPGVLDTLVDRAGAPSNDVRALAASAVGERLVADSMAAARQVGVSGTPTWLVGDLMIPGAVDTATVERWVTRLLARAQRASG